MKNPYNQQSQTLSEKVAPAAAIALLGFIIWIISTYDI